MILVVEGSAHTILIAASRMGRDFSPRVAVKLDASLLEDVIGLETSNGSLRARRYTYLSRVTETQGRVHPGEMLSARSAFERAGIRGDCRAEQSASRRPASGQAGCPHRSSWLPPPTPQF